MRQVGPHRVLYSPSDAAIVDGLVLEVRVKRESPGGAGQRYVYAKARGAPNVPGAWVRLHRLLLGLGRGQGQVDHINGDGLDNRRENIRACTNSQNQMNRRKSPMQKTASRYKGVVFDAERGKWRAQLKRDGKRYRGPRRKSELQAALDYDLLAEKHFGEFARLNFPDVVLGPDEDAW